MTTRLVVNADDFGRDPEVDRGILDAYQDGIVSTTTVLINMPDAVQAVTEAHARAPELGIGLHLNLTLGVPCADFLQHSALVGKDNRFHPLEHWHNNPGMVGIKAVEAEWRSQIELLESSGILIDHLDSHHHIAAIREDIWQLYLDLALELGCGVRPPFPDDVSLEALKRSFPTEMLEHAKTMALPALRQSRVPHPTWFFASFFGEYAHLNHLLQLLDSMPSGVCELMCHPGYSSPALERSSGYARQRLTELEALTHPLAIQSIAEHEIELVTYRQVWSTF